jgi:rsbT co-antagonist protein RsbR
MRRHTLTQQVTFVAIIICGIIILAAATSIRSFRTIQDAATHVSHDIPAQLDLGDHFVENLAQILDEASAFYDGGDLEDLQEAQEALLVARAQLEQLLALEAADEYQHLAMNANLQHEELVQTRTVILNQATDVLGLLATGNEQAGMGMDDTLEQLEDALQQLKLDQDAFFAQKNMAVASAVDQAIRRGLTIVSITFALMVLLILAAVVLLRRRIVKPIKQLATVARTVGSVHSNVVIPITNHDEIGDLQVAFNEMMTTIRQQTSLLEHEVTSARTAQREAETLRETLAVQLATIDTQRGAIREMSVPILPLTKTTLVMPLVGTLDSARLRVMQAQALAVLERTSARYLLLDVTGVPIIDNEVAQGFTQMVQAAQLLGTQVIVTGIRPEVAQTLVGLGMNVQSMATLSTLQSGIAFAMEQELKSRAAQRTK